MVRLKIGSEDVKELDVERSSILALGYLGLVQQMVDDLGMASELSATMLSPYQRSG